MCEKEPAVEAALFPFVVGGELRLLGCAAPRVFFPFNDCPPADACASAGELYAVIRPRALRGPYRGGSTESRGLHGYAYADGSRAS